MNKKILSILIILFYLQLNFSYSFAYTQQNFGNFPPAKNIENKPNTKTKKKSPWIALAISFFPGIIIHGAGHTYAGKHKTAGLLFTCELIGLGLIGAGIVVVSLTVFTKVGTLGTADISSETSDLAKFLFGAGSGLFVGSWVYDVIGAPLACRQENYSKEKINIIKITMRF